MAKKKPKHCPKCGQFNPGAGHSLKCPGKKLKTAPVAAPSAKEVISRKAPEDSVSSTPSIDASTYNNVFASYRTKVKTSPYKPNTRAAKANTSSSVSQAQPTPVRKHKLDEYRYGIENAYHGKVRISVNYAVKTLSSPVRTVDPQGNPVGQAPFNSKKAGRSLRLVALGVSNYDSKKHGGVNNVYSPTTKQLAKTLLNAPQNKNGVPDYFEYNKSTGGYHYLKPEVKQFLKSVDLDLKTNEKLNIAKLSNA